MRKSVKILTAVAVAGLAFAASAAYTGTGVTNNAGASQFVGGSVTQTVTGATLSDLAYGFTDASKTAVNKVTLTFADAANGTAPTLTLAGGTQAQFTCTVIDSITFKSVCDAATGTSQTGVTGATITVS